MWRRRITTRTEARCASSTRDRTSQDVSGDLPRLQKRRVFTRGSRMSRAQTNHRQRPFAVVAGNLNLVRCLGHAGIPVFCATSDANKVAFHSRYVSRSRKTPSPTQAPSEFIDELVRIGQQDLETKGVLYYDGDGDLLAISANRVRLEDYYDFLIPDHSLIEVLLDKRRFSKFASECGLKVPKNAFFGSGEYGHPCS